MGFLDHSTNNIIVDAVLTDLGRQRLSRNNGSFSIVKFALGDDEVDYSIVKKFGLTIGREKIEKNTPIFEAQTSSNLGLKHKLLSLSSQVETSLPILAASSESVQIANNNNAGMQVTITQQPAAGAGRVVSADLQETVFMIRASTRFLDIVYNGSTLNPVYATERDRMGIYRIPTTVAAGDSGYRRAVLNFRVKQSLRSNNTVYNTFGDSDGRIYTNVVVTGLLSGAQKNLSLTLLPPA